MNLPPDAAERLDAARAPARHRAEILAGLIPSPALNEVVCWWQDPRRPTFLVLTGSVGVGKTTAACLALALAPNGLFAPAAALARIGRYKEADAREWHEMIRSIPLVVDDLGTEPLDAGGWVLSLWDELIEERYCEDLATVVTTNLTATALATRYRARIADRFRSVARIVSIAGPSRRKTLEDPDA